MIHEALEILKSWSSIDTWIVITATLAAMACALPGVFLVIRRQSMMGDALSHTALPGIVTAFLFAHWLKASGWISAEVYDSWRHAAMFSGALIVGILSAALTQWIQNLGKVEASAALGVVFTSLFAVGLLLIRIAADQVHIDPDCVLYGNIETVVMDTWRGVPRAAYINALVLTLNLALVVLFFKELRVSAFDPALSTTLGINARVMHYALMAVTAATLVSAFETVGSILVIAMLITPAATAHLFTDRLSLLIVLSLAVAAVCAGLGHVLAITVPPIVFSRLGFPSVDDASVAGMMAVAGGIVFLLSALFAPRYGILSKVVHQARLGIRIAADDVLGLLYRLEEKAEAPSSSHLGSVTAGVSPWLNRLAVFDLTRRGQIAAGPDGYQLTASGRKRAANLVRSHRLWESYLFKHFELPPDHLHNSAALAEHFIDPDMQADLLAEFDETGLDPHGREIPRSDGDGDG